MKHHAGTANLASLFKINEDYVPINLLNYQELLHGFGTSNRKSSTKTNLIN